MGSSIYPSRVLVAVLGWQRWPVQSARVVHQRSLRKASKGKVGTLAQVKAKRSGYRDHSTSHHQEGQLVFYN